MDPLFDINSEWFADTVPVIIATLFILLSLVRRLPTLLKLFQPQARPLTTMITCPNCGALNVPQLKKCASCNTSLAQSSGTLTQSKSEDDRSVPPLVKKL